MFSLDGNNGSDVGRDAIFCIYGINEPLWILFSFSCWKNFDIIQLFLCQFSDVWNFTSFSVFFKTDQRIQIFYKINWGAESVSPTIQMIVPKWAKIYGKFTPYLVRLISFSNILEGLMSYRFLLMSTSQTINPRLSTKTFDQIWICTTKRVRFLMTKIPNHEIKKKTVG